MQESAKELGGITPACAGKSGSPGLSLRCAPDHPRMCGEERLMSGCSRPTRGSPPHVRGRERTDPPRRWGGGITPACAGKRAFSSSRVIRPGDHPRMCGEEPWRPSPRRTRMGSPPHVRGRDFQRLVITEGQRITPACAGKRMGQVPPSGASWDHPRMCGEERELSVDGVGTEGSPPHVRGRGVVTRWKVNFHGITPACAGKR